MLTQFSALERWILNLQVQLLLFGFALLPPTTLRIEVIIQQEERRKIPLRQTGEQHFISSQTFHTLSHLGLGSPA